MSPTSPSSRLPDLTGAFVDEGYLQLVELLACGGFAKVYRALDTTSSPEDPVFYAVNMHMAVTHQPGVVDFHRIFTDGPEGEFVFMVLDLETDNMLDLIFRRQLYADRPALVKEVSLEVLDAVAQCHDDDVFHRDLKPQNILCTSKGTGIRLADFGFATREEQSNVFRAGTLSYMSPDASGVFPGLEDDRGHPFLVHRWHAAPRDGKNELFFDSLQRPETDYIQEWSTTTGGEGNTTFFSVSLSFCSFPVDPAHPVPDADLTGTATAPPTASQTRGR
ncbi:kinase-like domain-containing protein [Mycena metata]|uniref:Kinase-like domain-containing protein n=1 Tax=Mycena metata TaxID=1033252 RepID=A0AAD7I4Q1_9AGAR|nr:kinase-like domain-containing protein [Mycena metata]